MPHSSNWRLASELEICSILRSQSKRCLLLLLRYHPCVKRVIMYSRYVDCRKIIGGGNLHGANSFEAHLESPLFWRFDIDQRALGIVLERWRIPANLVPTWSNKLSNKSETHSYIERQQKYKWLRNVYLSRIELRLRCVFRAIARQNDLARNERRQSGDRKCGE